MPLRSPAGFISAFFDPLKNPDAPTSPAATGGDATASVSFTAPANVGGSAITAYYAVSNPSQVTVSGATSPISVTGLTNGTAYTFNVWALNSYGSGPWSVATGSVTPAANPNRGLFAGGQGVGALISYVTIPTTGNATTFGNLTVERRYLGACASSSRGVFGGGEGDVNTIDYVTIATTGNATAFGALTQNRRSLAGCNSSTRGVFGGGQNEGSTFYNTIDYITIATTGNAISFGQLTQTMAQLAGCSSPTRGIFAGGGSSTSSVINYITISTTGNATSFGSLSVGRYQISGFSSSTRGVFGSGQGTDTSTIDYITIASTGNATTFGSMSTGTTIRYGACSSETRGLFGGGLVLPAYSTLSVIGYVTIATTGNTTSFGNLTTDYYGSAACSSINGGL